MGTIVGVAVAFLVGAVVGYKRGKVVAARLAEIKARLSGGK